MALDFEGSLSGLSRLDLWYKVTGNEELYLSDITEIIRLRWPYFRDNWEFLKDKYLGLMKTYSDPKLLQTQINNFSEFVESQRNSKTNKNPFENSDIIPRFYSIFDSTTINSVSLTYEERQIVENKKREVNAYTRGDFLAIRDQLAKERDQIADRDGTTDPDYNRVFNRSPLEARVDINNKDINKMYQLQEAIKSTDFILANSFSLSTATIDPFALAKSNANNPAIDIQSYSSGYLTKLNYGEDLQALAARTLDSPDKWIDIAITNGLKAPYIDEVGERLFLISNASGNQINIAETDINNNLNIDKLSIGQVVLLQSTTQTFPEQRTIQNITQVPISGEIIIELAGESNLDRYKLSESAYVRVFKPNTINSSFYIMIPSTLPLDDTSKSDTPWFLQGSDGTDKRQKVDLNIDENGDLNFNSTGDLQLSYAMTNAVQAIKLKMMVEAGELRRHPEFGLNPVVGLTNANIALTRQILTNSISKMIQADERFASIDTLDITYGTGVDSNFPTVININLIVKLAGSGQLLPVTFSINKG
jgi:hypothetical protein